MKRNLDIACLRLFTLIVERGGLGKAAAAVGRSQPAASLQIKRLEEEFGEPLFQRDGRGLALTKAGFELLPAARGIVQLHDLALAGRIKSKLTGVVRLGIAQDLADSVLTPILAEFANNHPSVELLVRTDRMLELIEAIRNDALDLALVFDTSDDKLAGERIAQLPMRWIGRHSETAVHAQSLALVAFDGACCFNRAAEIALSQAGRSWRRTFTSSSLASQWAAIRAGLGIGVRTALSLPADLQTLDESYELPDLPLVALCMLSRLGEVNPAVKYLTDKLRTSCREIVLNIAA